MLSFSHTVVILSIVILQQRAEKCSKGMKAVVMFLLKTVVEACPVPGQYFQTGMCVYCLVEA